MGRNNFNDLSINSIGYIGINKSNPSNQLHVTGNAKITRYLNVGGQGTFTNSWIVSHNRNCLELVPSSIALGCTNSCITCILTNICYCNNINCLNNFYAISYISNSNSNFMGQVGISKNSVNYNLDVNGSINCNTTYCTNIQNGNIRLLKCWIMYAPITPILVQFWQKFIAIYFKTGVYQINFNEITPPQMYYSVSICGSWNCTYDGNSGLI